MLLLSRLWRLSKRSPSVLSMDAHRLTFHIRKSFETNTIHDWGVEELRDVAFQVLANKDEYKKNGKDLLKTYYTLVRSPNPSLYKQTLGFPYINGHLKDNYRSFGGDMHGMVTLEDSRNDGQDGLSGVHIAEHSPIHDMLLVNCSKFMAKWSAKIIREHLGDAEMVSDYLAKSGKCNAYERSEDACDRPGSL